MTFLDTLNSALVPKGNKLLSYLARVSSNFGRGNFDKDSSLANVEGAPSGRKKRFSRFIVVLLSNFQLRMMEGNGPKHEN